MFISKVLDNLLFHIMWTRTHHMVRLGAYFCLPIGNDYHLRTDFERTKLPKPRDEGVTALLTGMGIFVVGAGEAGDQPCRSTGMRLLPRKL